MAQVLYLVLLGLAVVGWFISENRNSLGQTARQAMVWGFIFLGLIAGAGLWADIRDDMMPQQSYISGENRVEVPRSLDGHYRLTLSINGEPVDFVVDTGASELVLSRRDAMRAGIDADNLAYFGRAQTANGMVETADVTLDEVQLGGLVDHGVAASVNSGDMDSSLLGMSYLQRFDRIEISGNRLILER